MHRPTFLFGVLLFAIALLARTIDAQEAAWFTGAVSPLMDAVWQERTDRIKELLSAGEDPNAPTGKPAMTPWQVAVLTGHQPTLDLFTAHRAARPAAHYTMALFKTALQRGDARLVSEFVAAGAPLQFTRAEYSPLSLAAASGYVDVMRVLLDAKADVDAQDGFGDTALMAAVRSGRFDAVHLLIERGANIALKDAEGRTAMAWAMRAGKRSVIDALRKAGAETFELSATPAHTAHVDFLPRAAVQRSLQLLQRAGATWNERTKCASCHTQGVLVPVVRLAREKKFEVDAAMAQSQEARLRESMDGFAPVVDAALGNEPNAAVRFALGFFAQAASGGTRLQLGLEGMPMLPIDQKTAVALGRIQLRDGRWHTGGLRVPLHETDIQTTALMVRDLRTLAPQDQETEMRVKLAGTWLMSSAASTSQDKAYRLQGLTWAGADRGAIEAAIHALIEEQDVDGGWSQLPGMNADAYATGVALLALHDAGVPSSDPHYQHGVRYLLRTQEADGSWFVHKRAAMFNPYFESGFPHGHHQFSSFLGTGAATMALMHAVD